MDDIETKRQSSDRFKDSRNKKQFGLKLLGVIIFIALISLAGFFPLLLFLFLG